MAEPTVNTLKMLRKNLLKTGSPLLLAWAIACIASCKTRDFAVIPEVPYTVLERSAGVTEPPKEDRGALSEDELVELALARDPTVISLREAVQVAKAQCATFPDLRDPQIGLAYGQGDRVVERSWLVPRAEWRAATAYPSRGIFLSTHEEELALETDPRIPRVLIPAGTEEGYLERWPRRYRGTVADMDYIRGSVRFYPPNPFLFSARKEMARANYAAALCALQHAEWTVRCRVRALVTQLRYLEDQVAIATEIATLKKVLAGYSQELAKEGGLSGLEAFVSIEEYHRAERARDKLLGDVFAVRSELESLVGVPVRILPPVRCNFSTTSLERITSSFVEVVLRNRKDVSAAYWRAQVAEARYREWKRSTVPWFTQLEGSYARMTREDRAETAWELNRGADELDPLFSVPIDELKESEWRVEAMVSVPVFTALFGDRKVRDAERRKSWAELAALTQQAVSAARLGIERVKEAVRTDESVGQGITKRLEESDLWMETLRSQETVPKGEEERLRLAQCNLRQILILNEYEKLRAWLALEEVLGIPLTE